MGEFVLLVGLLLVGASLYLAAQPQAMIALIDRALTTRWLFLAALFRLMLGAGLIASASTVLFSKFVSALGWLSVLSGLILVAVPTTVWDSLGEWLKGLPISLLRLWTLFALALGGFLMFASLA